MVDRPIYIVGVGRSGTTILGTCLSAHHDVGYLNEPKLIWSEIVDNDDLIGSYNTRIGTYRLSREDVTDIISCKLHSVFGGYLALTGSKRLVDKYPEMAFRYQFLVEQFPDAKFIALVRNGIDTCRSIEAWSFRKGRRQENTITEDWWGLNDRKWGIICDELIPCDPELAPYYHQIRSYRDHRARAAVEWILTMKQLLLISKESNVEIFKYETLVSDEDERKRLLDFCELKSDEHFFSYCNSVFSEPTTYHNSTYEMLPRELVEPFKSLMFNLGYED